MKAPMGDTYVPTQTRTQTLIQLSHLKRRETNTQTHIITPTSECMGLADRQRLRSSFTGLLLSLVLNYFLKSTSGLQGASKEAQQRKTTSLSAFQAYLLYIRHPAPSLYLIGTSTGNAPLFLYLI